MAYSLWFVFFVLFHFAIELIPCAQTFSRRDFPSAPKLVFGSGTSAYQYEGAANEDGRTPSYWDTFAHAGHAHGDTGDIACDGYHKYKEDVQLMVETGLDDCRFSISWSRLIPNGRGPVNPKGLKYYNGVINELIKNGIQPHVTLNHLDLPQILEDEYEGWLSPKIVEDFTAYTDVCFREFGDRVAHWTTLNEPNIFAADGYDTGKIPPQRCSPPYGNCSAGNSSVESYVAGHNILLAHASAARLYKNKYRSRQHGLVGINLYAYWPIPHTNATEDVIAAERFNDFLLGWCLDPLVYGDCPAIMKEKVGTRLPAFTEVESKYVKGTCDFIGVNHYFVVHVKDCSLNPDGKDFYGDMGVQWIFGGNGPQGELPVTPSGLLELLEYLKQFYGDIPIYVHENGQSTRKNVTSNDQPRVEYLQGYIGSLLEAVRNGSNVAGYFYWSFMDLYELFDGYEASYGLYYVDLNDKDLTRYPKLSAHWYTNFLKGNSKNSFDVVFEFKQEVLSPYLSSQSLILTLVCFQVK